MFGRARSLGIRAVVGAAVLRTFIGTLAAQDVALPTRLGEETDKPVYRARSEDRLAQQLQNPIADLTSVLLQSDIDGDVGPDQAGSRYTVNVLPVIPVDVGEDWLLVTRTLLPIIYQREVQGEGTGRAFGLGDTLQSFFISPKGGDGLSWGVGPAFLWPTATREVLGGEKWAAGPTGVVVLESGPWTAGVLANHLWSYSGSRSRADVNQTFVQPFAAVTFWKGTTLSVSTEAAYDWHADQWTVPLMAGFTQVIKLGELPIGLGVSGKYWADGPSSAPDWGVRFAVTLIFPR
jgi:hypothetical protein